MGKFDIYPIELSKKENQKGEERPPTLTVHLKLCKNAVSSIAFSKSMKTLALFTSMPLLGHGKGEVEFERVVFERQYF